ncbi:MAG: hypothetical protein GY845_14115 [Planctomycetes bacterium]|nr:hypothetical protein [Planctomycetota bacterium]
MEQQEQDITCESTSLTFEKRWCAICLFSIIAIGWLPLLLGLNTIQSIASLYPLANSTHPYFVPEHAVKLYLLMPLVVMSSCLLFLSPGLFLSLALNSAKSLGQWIFTSLALSLILISSVTGFVQSIMGKPLRGGWFASVVVLISIVCFIFLFVRITRNCQIAWPFGKAHNGTIIFSILVIILLFLITLAPKIYWENFNGDGVEAFEAGRLLLAQPLPFWPRSAGPIFELPNITMMLFTFPVSWFIRLFGEVEASARLPYILYVIALYGVILSLIEQGRTKPVGRIELWLIWLGLAVYSVVMAFSASYNPYNADIASPGNRDTLLMVCFFGFIFWFLRQEYIWMALFLCLTYLSSPAGQILVGLWLLAVILIWKPKPWLPVVITIGVILGCKLISAILPSICTAIPPLGGEHSFFALLNKLRFLLLSDWHRFVFLLVPSGIVPVISLVFWKHQDKIARSLTFVALVYFSFFYVQADTALHYFVPAMLIPLIVFWRYDFISNPRHRKLNLTCIGVIGIISLLISLPNNAAPNMSARLVGEAIEDRTGGYHELDPIAKRRFFLALCHLFPSSAARKVPHESYGGSPDQWYYYANRANGTTRNVNYVIQLSDHPPPVGMKLIVKKEGVALFVRSESLWANHCALRPPTPVESGIYAIQRDMLFLGRPKSMENIPDIIDLKEILERFGLDSLIDLLKRLKKKASISIDE